MWCGYVSVIIFKKAIRESGIWIIARGRSEEELEEVNQR
jgi:hypothetical protein